MITKNFFGKTTFGEDVFEYILDNENGVCAHILTYGGIIRKLLVEDMSGNITDVVLGYDTLEEYENNPGYYGALIGRNSNRIKNAEFVLNEVKYHLYKNDGNNNLHGGKTGFDKKVWEHDAKEENGNVYLTLKIMSPDGEEGFPGNMNLAVVYTVTSDNTLRIEYKAVCDKDTVANFTNHSYFNVSGHKSGAVDDQVLYVNSSFYTPNTEECVPSGEIQSVVNTPFDYRVPRPVGEGFSADFAQIQMFGGYDHNFCIDGFGKRIAAIIKSPQTGIVMKTITDLPGMQIYTQNIGEDTVNGKDGAVYKVHNCLCFETQFFPNCANVSHFPSSVLKAGEVFETVTEYAFSLEK